MGGPWDRLESLRGDRSAAPDAGPERALVEPPERIFDLGEVLRVAIAEREVALLLEDLAGRGGLRSVGHRVRRDDRGRQLLAKPVTLGSEHRTRIEDLRRRHRMIVRARVTSGISRILPGSTDWRLTAMAIAIDPVCGMEVETDLTDLKLEHEGKAYWFCGRGCLLEFRDDPDKYLDPTYQPSM
jgi:xanthine dehydrogenase accessory factor